MISLVGKVAGVSIPLGGRFLKPATPLVSEGDEVSFEQKIGEPVDEGFSIGVWSGMDGTITAIEEDVVQISGGAMPTRRPRPRRRRKPRGRFLIRLQEEAGVQAPAFLFRACTEPSPFVTQFPTRSP